jgi:cytochrome c oxidase subunit I+III
MRVQLAQPNNDFLGPEAYNQLFTMHGTTMMFLFVIPFLEGLASYLLPLQLGTRDRPFPRYNAFNYWCYLFGGLILYSSVLVAMVPQQGWFAYVPLSGPEFADKAMDFWLAGLTLAELAAIGAAIEIAVVILKMRAPGMSLDRMPIFAWTMLAVAFLIIVAFVPLLVASTMLELDRLVGTAFFDSDAGGNPLLWQHLFWIFGHPEVYVMFLPAAAIISHVVPVHSRQALQGYRLVVLAVVTTAVISLGLWVHHMFTTGLPPLSLSFFTAASMTITLASGVQVLAWLATLWLGRPRLTVPMMYALGFLLTFVAGGITGVMVASVPFDEQVHDTFFVVAHFHYVLIGGVLFPIFAGLWHWWAKFTGRTLAPALGHVSFWLVFLGFHTTFFPLHLAGLWGMPRRVYTYSDDLDVGAVNLLATVGAFVLAAGVLVFTSALVISLLRGRPAAPNPWGGDSLEWSIASPPPSANFDRIPAVASRTPMWEPAPHGRFEDVVAAFDRKPVDTRAAPSTTVLGAEPDGAVRLALPTVRPFVAAAGLLVAAVGLLASSWWIGLGGLAVFAVGCVAWVLINEAEHQVEVEEPAVGPFRFENPGASSIGWWGAAGGAAVAAVAMATVMFSSFYLQVNTAAWPPGDTLGRPLLSAVTAVALTVAVGATWRGARLRSGVGSDPRPAHTRAGLVALAAGAVALVSVILTGWLDGVDPAAHAYDSSALLLIGGQATLVVGALSLTGVSLVARRRHRRSSRPANLLQQSALLWGTALLTWLGAWATLDLLPAVI